jgi:hypothetical protein
MDRKVTPHGRIGTTCFILEFPPSSQETKRCMITEDASGLIHSAPKVSRHSDDEKLSHFGGSNTCSSGGIRTTSLEESV